MKQSKNTKRAFLGSVISLAVCAAMLVGTTFAWFTDSASVGVSSIKSGKLDIALVNEAGDNIEGTTLEFTKAAGHESEPVLWEPGCTYSLPKVFVKNDGNLALKYKLSISGINGDEMLNEAIDWTINGVALDTELSLLPNAQSDALTITGHMKEDAGNEYQGLSITGVSITVIATQDTVEYDSNGNQYDKDAEYPEVPDYTVSNVEELKDALTEAETGDVVAVKSGNYVFNNNPLTVPNGVTLIGEQAGKSSAVDWAKDPSAKKTVIQATDDPKEELLRLEDNTVVDGIEFRDAYKGIRADGKENIVIKNVSMVNTTGVVAKEGGDGIDFDNCIDPVIENSYFSDIMDCSIEFEDYTSTGKAKIVNNVIENTTNTSNGAIKVGPGSGDVEISSNTINKLNSTQSQGSSLVKCSAIHIYCVTSGTITISKNTIKDVTQGIAIYKFWPDDNNSKVIIKDNDISDCSTFGIATSYLNMNKTGTTAVVDIAGNKITTIGNAKGIDIRNEQPKDSWTVNVLDGNTVDGDAVASYTATNNG